MRWFALALAACTARTPPPQNRTVTPTRAAAAASIRVTFAAVPAGANADPTTATITGAAFDLEHRPLVQAIIVAVSAALPDEKPVVSDAAGRFIIADVPPGHYTLTYYYNDRQKTFELDVTAGSRIATRVDGWPLGLPPPQPPIEIRVD